MSRNIRPAVSLIKRGLRNSSGLPFPELLEMDKLDGLVKSVHAKFYNRIYTPLVTLLAFIAQVLDSDGLCRQAVRAHRRSTPFCRRSCGCAKSASLSNRRAFVHRRLTSLPPCSTRASTPQRRLPACTVGAGPSSLISATSRPRWAWRCCAPKRRRWQKRSARLFARLQLDTVVDLGRKTNLSHRHPTGEFQGQRAASFQFGPLSRHRRSTGFRRPLRKAHRHGR